MVKSDQQNTGVVERVLVSSSTKREVTNPNLAKNSGHGANAAYDSVEKSRLDTVDEEIFTDTVEGFAHLQENDSGLMCNLAQHNTILTNENQRLKTLQMGQ